MYDQSGVAGSCASAMLYVLRNLHTVSMVAAPWGPGMGVDTWAEACGRCLCSLSAQASVCAGGHAPSHGLRLPTSSPGSLTGISQAVLGK